MLLTLGQRSRPAATLRERLLDCHGRIRTFCALAHRLAHGAEGEPARQAAAQLHRYFSVALPLHVADEEQSLTPRLLRLGDPTVTEALEAMMREHLGLDAALHELLARWQEVGAQPTAARTSATQEAVASLQVQFEHHLLAEEERILPAIAQLPPAEVAAIVSEMQARRA